MPPGLMPEFLSNLWNPLANAAGLVFGAFVLHTWIRIRDRVTELRWTYATNQLASSAEDERFGRVQVLYNNDPVQNLFIPFLRVAHPFVEY